MKRYDESGNDSFMVESGKSNIEKKPYSMIHLATHGEFAGDIDNMFILAYDGLIRFDQLDKIIKVTKYKEIPLELLTLSACKVVGRVCIINATFAQCCVSR